MDNTWLEAQIEAVKLQIEAYNGAILAVGVGGAQSYTLDTGQTRTTVTKLDLDMLNRMADSLNNRLATLTARLTGCNTSHAVPGW